MNSPASKWIALAQLLRPQGRRGELLAERLTDLDTLFGAGRDVWLSKTDSPVPDATPVILEEHWSPTGKNAGRIVLKLSTSNSISDAEKLAKFNLLIPMDSIPALEEDTWFVHDLIGCTLLDGPTAVGEIVDLQFAVSPDGRTRLPDAAPLLVIQPTGAAVDSADGDNTLMVPFIRAWLHSVDLAGKQVHMDLPPGLTDLPESGPE